MNEYLVSSRKILEQLLSTGMFWKMGKFENVITQDTKATFKKNNRHFRFYHKQL